MNTMNYTLYNKIWVAKFPKLKILPLEIQHLIFQRVTHFWMHVYRADIFSQKWNPGTDTSWCACMCMTIFRFFFRFFLFFHFFRAKQTAAQLTTRRMWQRALSERQTLETAVTRSSVCLLDCELGRAAYVIGSHQLWQSSDSLLQTDWKQLWWWGRHTVIRRVIARFEPSLPASAEPLTSKSAVLDGAGTAIRHRKKQRSCIFFFFFSSSASFPSSVEALLI